MRIDGLDEGDDAGTRDALPREAVPREEARARDKAQRRDGEPEGVPSHDGASGQTRPGDDSSRDRASQGDATLRADAGEAVAVALAARDRGPVADRDAAGDGERAGGRHATGDDPRPGDHDEAGGAGAEIRVERALGYRAEVEAVYRAYAIDQGCARVERIERETVTPAMRRIEAEDPERHLAGLEHRLKERYRIEEKVVETVEERGHGVEEAFGMVKDAIRYTFCYSEEGYAEGVNRDCGRMEDAGFERSDLRNSWQHDEYKGINTRWRVPDSSQLFEVQFHTEASLAAKEETHDAYKQLRTLPEDDAEVGHLRAYQREVTAKVPVPPGALDISDYP